MLTQAQRKEYPAVPIKREHKDSISTSVKSLIEKEKEVIPIEKPISLKSPGPPSPGLEPVVRCSVIQRTPSASEAKAPKHLKDADAKLPAESQRHLEPEQDQPIDYHVPKRKDDSDSDEKEMKYRVVRRTRAIVSRPMYSIWGGEGKFNGIMSAAAGHGRSNGTQQNGAGQGQQGNNGGGNSNYGSAGNNGNGGAGSTSNGNGGGAGMSGAGSGSGGSGGGMGGRDGRSNYGPNSPPTGSLPPFYESLKGGNGAMNAYNAANANFLAQNSYNSMMSSNLNMDCDNQEFTSIGGGGYSSDANAAAKQYSMLHNAAYGIVLKDEIDLDYDSKSDSMNNMNGHMMQNSNYGGYDPNDGMMVDMGNGVVDPLQFTATLTFSSPADHALLDSFTDAVDLSQLLQRLPNDDQSSPSNNDLEISSTPSLTPDSVSVTAADNCLESFPEILLSRNGYDRSMYGLHAGGLGNNRFHHHENPPSYQQSREMQQLLQQQNQHHSVHHHEQLSISNGINYDMDSHSNMSLPSPSSGSMDAPPDAKPIIQSVSPHLQASMAIEAKQRVSIQTGTISEIGFYHYCVCLLPCLTFVSN